MLYLASASPRRRRLLKEAGLKFRVLSSGYIERHEGDERPSFLVKTHAVGKATAAASKIQNGTVLAADTLVYQDGKLIGKPRDLKHARRTLRSLQGRWHTVYTGVACFWVERGKVTKKRVFYEKTGVLLKKMTSEDIDRYFRRVHPLDKAGAYAIQENSEGLVRKVRGSFSNAVGLPMERLHFL